MFRAQIYFAAGLVLLTGCWHVSTDITLLSQKTLTAKPWDCDIAVMTQMPTDRAYEELGIIHARAHTDLTRMIPVLKEKACGLGADAIVIKQSTMLLHDRPAEATVVVIRYR